MFNRKSILAAAIALTVSVTAQCACADDSTPPPSRGALSYLSVSIIPSAEASDDIPRPDPTTNTSPKKVGGFSPDQARLMQDLSRIIIVNGASVCLAGSIRFN